MARNRIQFQKGLSEAGFATLYGTEDRCRAALALWRWPDGFVCPACGGTDHCTVGLRQLYQCNACRRQTSLTAGTVLASTKVPLTTWFRARYLITQTKQGISSIELGRRLGTTQTTAWKIKTKLAEVMRIASERDKLDGRIEMNDAYLGGEHGGGKSGRGSPGKTPIVAAVQTDEKGRPRRIKLSRIARFKRRRVKSLVKRIIVPGATVLTDGLACLRGIVDASCNHVAITTGSGRKAARHPAFKWVNTMLGNIKNAITGTYRALRKKHMVRYLAEFEWRFNHRFDLAAMIDALGRAAINTKPAPYWWLKMADYGA
jgi:transposase-like protein